METGDTLKWGGVLIILLHKRGKLKKVEIKTCRVEKGVKRLS